MEFAGYRRFESYGWVRSIGEQEFLEDANWDFCGSADGCLIAYNLVTNEFAWIRSEGDDA